MRIAIVNDLLVAIESLRRIILSVPGHEIAWVARNGEEAVKKTAVDRPDLILMDLIMPKMNGVEATRRIMSDTPCPILVVTATVGENAAKVFEAMGYGALDAVNVPMMGSGTAAQRSRYTLLRKINIIAKLRGVPTSKSKADNTFFSIEDLPKLVVIGSSTGGPKALAAILSAMTAPFAGSIVIIQHVDEKFSAGLADWLDSQTPLRVQLAPEGGPPKKGNVYVAGTNDHLIITPEHVFSYTTEPGNIPYRPSVDVFFNSVGVNWPQTGVGVLLTGMGRDGAQGLLRLYQLGWHTIAQDETSSVVYGMPKAAKELGAVEQVLPIDDIGGAILDFAANRSFRKTR